MVKTSPTRLRDPVARREALLDAAATEFSRHGFDGARTRSIAAAAGVNPALIPYYFENKRGLYRAVVAAAVGEARPGLAALRQDPRPADRRLEALVEHLGDTFAANPRLPAMLLREYLEGGERLTPDVMAEIGEFFATTRAIVEDGVRAGTFRPVDPHAVHLGLTGSLVFFIASQPWRERAAAGGRLPAPAPALRDYVSQIRQLFLGGLSTQGSPPDTERGEP